MKKVLVTFYLIMILSPPLSSVYSLDNTSLTIQERMIQIISLVILWTAILGIGFLLYELIRLS